MMHKLMLLAFSILATAPALAKPVHSPWPGGIGIVRIAGDERPSVMVVDQQALILRADNEWIAVIGIPL